MPHARLEFRLTHRVFIFPPSPNKWDLPRVAAKDFSHVRIYFSNSRTRIPSLPQNFFIVPLLGSISLNCTDCFGAASFLFFSLLSRKDNLDFFHSGNIFSLALMSLVANSIDASLDKCLPVESTVWIKKYILLDNSFFFSFFHFMLSQAKLTAFSI